MYVYVDSSGIATCLRFSFFVSSRRRHTRFKGDWSSDVCSSDLVCRLLLENGRAHVYTPVTLESRMASSAGNGRIKRLTGPASCASSGADYTRQQASCSAEPRRV